MKKVTCGIFLIDNKNRVLLGHPTGAPDSVWSIPKGCMDKGETTWDTAVREFEEETDITLSDYTYIHKHIGSTTYYGSKGTAKILEAFVVYMPYNTIDLSRIVCKSTWGENDLPEVDKYHWVDVNIMRMFIVQPQKEVWDFANINKSFSCM